MSIFDTWKDYRAIRLFRAAGGRLIKAVQDDNGTIRPAFFNHKLASRYLVTGDEFTQKDFDRWDNKMAKIVDGIEWARGWHASERRSAVEIKSLRSENEQLRKQLQQLTVA